MLNLLLGINLPVCWITAYPVWFKYMPYSEDVTYVVGYAPVYNNLNSSLKEAKKVAKLNMITNRRDSIYGERFYRWSLYGKVYISEEINEYVDTSCIDNLDINIIDTAFVNDMVLILASDDNHDYVESPLFNDTTWVERPLNLSGWILETGTAPLYYYEQNSWLEAEKDARISLAMTLGYHLESFNKYSCTITGSSYEEICAVLRNIHVLSRYINYDMDYCKVIVGVKVKDMEVK